MNINISDCVLRLYVARKSRALRLLTNKNRREVIGKMLINLEAENFTDSHSCRPTENKEHPFARPPARRKERHNSTACSN